MLAIATMLNSREDRGRSKIGINPTMRNAIRVNTDFTELQEVIVERSDIVHLNKDHTQVPKEIKIFLRGFIEDSQGPYKCVSSVQEISRRRRASLLVTDYSVDKLSFRGEEFCAGCKHRLFQASGGKCVDLEYEEFSEGRR